MSDYKYSTGTGSEKTACAVGRDLGISSKFSIEICRWLRYRNLQNAKKLLEIVMERKTAVPFLKFTQDLGHKPGKMTSGRYPYKASEAILGVLKSVEKNAAFKNLDTDNLKIIHMCAQKASSPMHSGRHGGRAMKRTHIEIVVAEQKTAQKKGESAAHKKTSNTSSNASKSKESKSSLEAKQ